jgi:hypothetical protein
MGGKVFDKIILANGSTPQVPRMSPELYQKMINEYKPKLEVFFRNVVVPRDAPDKEDYGDIDFLVESDNKILLEGRTLSAEDQDFWKLVKVALTAELHEKRGQSHSFGIPILGVSGAYVQVDIELSPGNGTIDSLDLFAWTRFMKGDADLLQIIGVTHRPLGLTCNDRGLHVRLEQIEPYDKKKALLFLTRDPDKAMVFYGFDVKKYHEGFTSETELFDWVADGRYFSRQTFDERKERSTDRSRQLKRPMYRRFVEEYMSIPTVGIRRPCTRQDVLDEAIKTFNVRAEYNEMVAAHNAKVAEEELWRKIKDTIPAEGKALASAVRALHRWVVFRNHEPRLGDRPTEPEAYLKWSEYVGCSNEGQVLRWVRDRWQDVKSHDKAHQTAQPK